MGSLYFDKLRTICFKFELSCASADCLVALPAEKLLASYAKIPDGRPFPGHLASGL